MCGSGAGDWKDSAEGESTSASSACAACATRSPIVGPGNEDRERPASHCEGWDGLSKFVAVSLMKEISKTTAVIMGKRTRLLVRKEVLTDRISITE